MCRRAKTCSAWCLRCIGLLSKTLVLTHITVAAIVVSAAALSCHPIVDYYIKVYEVEDYEQTHKVLNRSLVLPWCVVALLCIFAQVTVWVVVDPLLWCVALVKSRRSSATDLVVQEEKHALDRPPMGAPGTFHKGKHHLKRRKYPTSFMAIKNK